MSGYFEKTILDQLLLEQQARSIPLLAAINQKNIPKIQRLLQKGVDVNMQAPGGGKTPLHLAVEMQDEKIVDILIKAKATVNVVTKTKKTPLHVASQLGNPGLIKKLVEAGARLDSVSEGGCTPLHEAAAAGHLAAVSVLLELKADPALRENRFNLTAANLAHEKGHENIRDLIIQSMTYQHRFMQNIRFILFNWKRAFPERSLSYQFLFNLEKEIGDSENSDQIFLIIREAFKIPAYTLVKKELDSARKLFIVNMKRYNADKIEALGHFSDSALFPKESLPDSNQQAKSLATALTKLGLLAKKKNKYQPIDIILEYCDLPKPK